MFYQPKYLSKNKKEMEISPVFDASFTLRKSVDEAKKRSMIDQIEKSETKKGFIE